MKIQSKLTEADQWISKAQWDAMPSYRQRRYNIIDSTDGEVQEIIIPETIIDFEKLQSDDVPSIDEMRKVLKKEGISVHWNLKDEKVKGIYFEHIKGKENG